MIPIYMKHKHNPPHSYGDCLRACVASILEADDVPHFHVDGEADDAVIRSRLDDYLRTEHALTSWAIGYGEIPLDDMLSGLSDDNPGKNFILFGAISTGEPHAVVCRDGCVIHDPSSWPTGGLVGPYENGWVVLLFVPESVCYGDW